MSQNYQHGYLRRAKRKSGPHCWEFLWREHDETGKRVRRTAIIGTVEQYTTEEQALAVANGLQMQINADRNRHPAHPISIGNLIDHYVQTELLAEAGWHSHATITVYRYFLKKWIRPHWGEVALRCVRTIAVEHWLRRLQRADGTPLANPTKAKIRNIFSVLFNHAIRYEWLEQGKNPITLVRQSAKRMSVPEVLESSDIQALLVQLDSCSRLMVTLAVTTGLRRSELFALRWGDVNFSDLEISVRRSIYRGTIGDCKTETSRKPLQKVIRPAALKAGIRKKIGWHTFRHTYSTLLIANGENVKVVQELMRHASSQFTLEIYSQAQIIAKRQAQQRLVQAIFPEQADELPPVIKCHAESNYRR